MIEDVSPAVKHLEAADAVLTRAFVQAVEATHPAEYQLQDARELVRVALSRVRIVVAAQKVAAASPAPHVSDVEASENALARRKGGAS